MRRQDGRCRFGTPEAAHKPRLLPVEARAVHRNRTAPHHSRVGRADAGNEARGDDHFNRGGGGGLPGEGDEYRPGRRGEGPNAGEGARREGAGGVDERGGRVSCPEEAGEVRAREEACPADRDRLRVRVHAPRLDGEEGGLRHDEERDAWGLGLRVYGLGLRFRVEG